MKNNIKKEETEGNYADDPLYIILFLVILWVSFIFLYFLLLKCVSVTSTCLAHAKQTVYSKYRPNTKV
jgi:hypothetical protein